MTGNDRRFGVVGLGAMGMHLALHMWRAGLDVVGFDVDPAAVGRVRQAGLSVAESVRRLGAAADVVLVVVVNDEQVRSVLLGADGLCAAMKPGSTIAICAAVKPVTVREMAEQARRAGLDVVDVALVGGARRAEQGRLTLFCGGSAEAIDACARAFAAFSTNICRAGAVGDAQIAKVANNLLLWSCLRIDYEAQALAKKLGLDPTVVRPLLAVGTGSNVALQEWGLHRPQWPAKDLDLALELAREADVDMPYTRALRELADELAPPL